MMVVEIWFSVLSGLLINLAAGWLGAAVILPVTYKPPRQVNTLVLTGNILLAIFALVLAFELREYVKL